MGTSEERREPLYFELARTYTFDTEKLNSEAHSAFKAFLKSVVGKYNSHGVQAQLVIEPKDRKKTYFFVTASKGAQQWFNSIIRDIDEELHKVQPQQKQLKDGVCIGTGTQMPMEYWYHVPSATRREVKPGEICYSQELESNVILHHIIDGVSNAELEKLRPVIQRLTRMDTDDNNMSKVLAIPTNRSESLYTLCFVGVPPTALRGDFAIDSQQHSTQVEVLMARGGKSAARATYEAVKRELGRIRGGSRGDL